MALPATFFLEPDASDALELPEGVDRTEFERLDGQIRALVAEYRQHAPEEGSEEERHLFIRYLSITMGAASLLRASLSKTLQQSAMRALHRLVVREYATTDVERKFALRQLQQAVEAYAVLVEQFGMLVSAHPLNLTEAFMTALRSYLAHGDVDFSRDDVAVLRFQLDLFAALTALDAPLEELTRLAFRAASATRRVQALGNVLGPARLRAELKRIKARTAWLDWTHEEVEKELEPWPARPSS